MLTKITAIPIGAIGFPFIKKFQGTWYTGKVIHILENDKRVCRFNDNECKQYTLPRLEQFSKDINIDNVYYDDDDEDMEDEDEVVEIDDDSDNEDLAAKERPPQEILSGKLLKKLLCVPPGMTADQHLAV